jgi:hypothetical protein
VKIRVLIVLSIALSLSVQAQKKSLADTTIRMFALSGQLGIQQAFGDMGNRFGYGGLTGGSLILKTSKNWTIEGTFGFLFGGQNQVKEDTILKPLMTETGIFIGRDGNPVDVYLFERGFVSTLRIGKVIPVIGPNMNSGIHLAIGLGAMQHKIRIQEELETLPQLSKAYKRGYDRLTNGWCLSQSLGYQHFSTRRFINYYCGIELYEGFTMNRRSLNFDTQLRDDRQRLDIMGSIVLRWYFPMYKREAREYYFY